MKKVKKVYKAIETSDGAGVKLNRVFGYNEIPDFDPFLLLDYFATNNPEDVIRGFPWHPHRGIETITYLIKGEIEHQDSLGNKGVISNSDVQWMTAGSGIVHQEMPNTSENGIEGFQLWLNLPSKDKMTEPKYGDIKGEMIKTIVDAGNTIKVIGGKYEDIEGPINREHLGVSLFDVTVSAGNKFQYSTGEGINTFIFVFKGSGWFGENKDKISYKEAAVFEGNGVLKVEAESELRFLLGEGYPLNEKIAWGGPIVMNTKEELRTAFKEYEEGTFIKHR